MTNWTIRFFAVIFVLLSGIACSYLFAQQDTKGETIDDEDMGVVSFEEMNYPTIARAARREGVVVVRVKLDEKGKVLAAFAISGSKMLVPESISNVEKWRFRPNPARSAVVLYDFRLVEGKCDPSRNRLFVFREPNIASVASCVDVWQPQR